MYNMEVGMAKGHVVFCADGGTRGKVSGTEENTGQGVGGRLIV